MSHPTNNNLLERAGDMVSEWEGTDVELAIKKAIKDNDLKLLNYLVVQAEAETARQDFYNNDTN